MLRTLALALGVVVLTGVAAPPARADDDGWRRHHDWREHEWRGHEWRDHYRYRVYPAYPGYSYYAPPPVVYAPPPVIYAPPPAYYAPPGINFVIPLHIH
jgi:hypothetical protein